MNPEEEHLKPEYYGTQVQVAGMSDQSKGAVVEIQCLGVLKMSVSGI